MQQILNFPLVNQVSFNFRRDKFEAPDFQILADKNVELFPLYTKTSTKITKPIPAKDKLIDKYRNLKRKYTFYKQINENPVDEENESSNVNNTGNLLWISFNHKNIFLFYSRTTP